MTGGGGPIISAQGLCGHARRFLTMAWARSELVVQLVQFVVLRARSRGVEANCIE